MGVWPSKVGTFTSHLYARLAPTLISMRKLNMLPTPQILPFIPPRRILMGPGPSDIYPQVLAAQSKPTIGHLDPLFIKMMDEVKALTQYAFQTRNEMTMVLSAPGSAGMEACFVNLVEQEKKSLFAVMAFLASVCVKI